MWCALPPRFQVSNTRDQTQTKISGTKKSDEQFFPFFIMVSTSLTPKLRMVLIRNDELKAMAQKSALFCTNEKSGFNDGLQVDMVFSLFLEFELGLHPRE